MGLTNTSEILVEQAIRAGLNYIVSLQSKEGSWCEWELPPGSSTTWATAYIGYKLRCLPSPIKQGIKPNLFLAGNWLLDNIFEDNGWGYNHVVGSDADSTAFAILFLTSVGYHVPEGSYDHLIQYQCSSGGFSTYHPAGISDSWTVPHPDVTPMVLLALLSQNMLSNYSLKIGIDYVLKQRTLNFWWNSFWWSSPIYATEANLSLLNTIGIFSPWPSSIERFFPKNAFEVALLISSLLYLHPTYFSSVITTQLNKLITTQRPDGSWNEAPTLRITKRNCFAPWKSTNPGPLFSDTNRLFTTATIIESLSNLYLTYWKYR